MNKSGLANLLMNENFNLLISLARAVNHVPPEFRVHRFEYISQIINADLKTNFSIQETVDFAQSIECLVHKIHEVPTDDLLWQISLTSGVGYMLFMAPPTSNCLKCQGMLHSHNKAVTVMCFGFNGPLLASKITLRCQNCQINYR